VYAVGADDQVEPAGGTALEGDRHAIGVLLQRPDGIAEDVLDVVLRHLVQDRREVTAHELDLAAGVLALDGLQIDSRHAPVGGVHE
jgi:hypothetical protein